MTTIRDGSDLPSPTVPATAGTNETASSVFVEMAAWCKRVYPVNRHRYTVRLRRDMWEALAHEIFMQQRAIPAWEERPFVVLIRNVQILPWDRA